MKPRQLVAPSLAFATALLLGAMGSGCGSSSGSSVTGPTSDNLEMNAPRSDYGVDQDQGSRRGPGLPDGPLLNSGTEY